MDTPPPRLYKYMNPDRQGILDNWLIRFTQPKALNDPFEMRLHIAGYGTHDEVLQIAARRWELHVRERYDDLVREHGPRITFDEFRARIEPERTAMIETAMARASEHNAEMARRIDDLMNTSIGVLSLCEHPDSLLMWPHYGDSHRGFVIEFDTASPFFNQTRPPPHVTVTDEAAAAFAEEHGRLRRITYQVARPSVVVTRLTFDLILTKGEEWRYEGEWRMLMPLEYANETRPTHQGFPVHLFAVPPSAVTKVMLGANADDALLAHALQLRSRTETRHIVIEKGRIDEERYQLHFEAV
jgi:hypothetical protein